MSALARCVAPEVELPMVWPFIFSQPDSVSKVARNLMSPVDRTVVGSTLDPPPPPPDDGPTTCITG